ncbi:hypothetical protein LEP1GSC041_2922 [Leptospira noguchii str. 2006001870]|nr:hypothetical protein LEP1GSC041_2922 [Leptospira noguchii str. 2006001870]
MWELLHIFAKKSSYLFENFTFCVSSHILFFTEKEISYTELKLNERDSYNAKGIDARSIN